MDKKIPNNDKPVEEVLRDFVGRRNGIIKALTTDFDVFFQECDPERENLCLYGYPNLQWEVKLPAEEVPPEIPEPALGINFSRDGMLSKDWLAFVCVHSDAWLLSVAFYFAARFGFGKADRKRLFSMMNDVPSVYEIVIGTAQKQSKGKSSVSDNGSNKSKSVKYLEQTSEKEEGDELNEEGDDHHGDTLCGVCADHYTRDEFWICCDVCERWFHGICVKITPAKAENIRQYKCPVCSKSAKP